MKRKIILLTLLLSQSVWAHEPSRGIIHGAGGPFLFRNHYETTRVADSSTWTGGTLMGIGDVDHNGSIEISITYLKQIYARRQDGLLNLEKAQRLYISTGYRHWIDKYHSLGLSFFSAYALGDQRVVYTDFPLATRPTSSAGDTTEYGFEFSFQREAFQMGRFSAIFDARYSLSITSKDYEDSNHYGLLIALKYLIQDPQRGIKP